jgi:serine/threonine protein phosphatase PrpC
MSLTLRAVMATDPGKIRSNNEDTAYAGVRLVVVADGMGGLPAGELASDIVVAGLRPLDTTDSDVDALELLRDAVYAANDEIKVQADADPERYGMGTTCTAMMLNGDHMSVVHVGDSRGYRLREGKLEQITRDDTYVQLLVDLGEIDVSEARDHPQRSLVTQALQGGAYEPHVFDLDAVPGDRLLLCSDGLSDVITDESIRDVLTTHEDLEEAAARLVELTLRAGAPDNVTVVLADLS